MGIWHSRQTASLRGNRFYRRPERSHCFDLSLFRQPSLKQGAHLAAVGRRIRSGMGIRENGRQFR